MATTEDRAFAATSWDTEVVHDAREDKDYAPWSEAEAIAFLESIETDLQYVMSVEGRKFIETQLEAEED